MSKATQFIGIDVSKEHLDTYCSPSGERRRDANDATGHHHLIRWLRRRSVALVVLEGTGGFEYPAAAAVAEAKFPVAVVNPRQVRDFAKAKGMLEKTDRLDAQVIAEFAHAVHPEPTFLPDDQRRELREVVRRREQLIKIRTAEWNRREHADSPRVHASVDAMVEAVNAQLDHLDAQLEHLITASPIWRVQHDLLATIPGVGQQTARMMIAALPELGHLNRHQIAKLVGLAPLCKDSGRRNGKRAIRGGRSHVRRALYMATVTAIRMNPRFKEYYNTLKNKGKVSKVALVACMRKLLITMNTMVKENTTWKEQSNLCTT